MGIQNTVYNALTPCPVTDLNTCIEPEPDLWQSEYPGWLRLAQVRDHGQWQQVQLEQPGHDRRRRMPVEQDLSSTPRSAHQSTSTAAAPRWVCREASDRIGSLTGNEWGDLSFYTDNQIPVDSHLGRCLTSPGGANGYYGIVGFGAVVFTGDDEHAKWLEGAAISSACTPGTEYRDANFCTTPGGPFILDATGEVQLRR